jgi:FkbM family methyltransferase
MSKRIHSHIVRLVERVLPADSAEHLRYTVRSWRTKRNAQARARRENTWKQRKGQGDMVYTIQPKVRMHIYFDSVLCRYIYVDGFEDEERLFMNLFLRPGDVFIDIGSNIGLFSLIAAHLVGTTGKVYAFEPCLKTFQRLGANIALNKFKNVESNQIALSDVSQTMEIRASTEGFDGWNSFAKPYMGENYSTETVIASTWDEWASGKELAGRVTMMKIDVEGWEGKVLKGAQKALGRADAPVLQVEFTDDAAEAAGLSCREVYKDLIGLGYEVCRFDAERRQLVPDPIREKYPYCNLFAVKNRKFVQDRLDKPNPAL